MSGFRTVWLAFAALPVGALRVRCALLCLIALGLVSLRCGHAAPSRDIETESAVKAVAARAPVRMEVLSVGLNGRVPGPGQVFTIRYHIENPGPATRVTLGFFYRPGTPEPFADIPMVDRMGIMPQTVDIPERGRIDGRWVVAHYNYLYAPYGQQSVQYLTARDKGGKLIAAAPMPFQRSGQPPLAILAADQETGLTIERSILLALPERDKPNLDTVVIYRYLPEAWYEYASVRAVLLARPLGTLSPAEREALRTWVALGGYLMVLTPQVTDWVAAESSPWAEGMGQVVVLSAPKEADPLRTASSGEPQNIQPPLMSGYRLPDMRLVIAAVVIIILLIGPVLHLFLARKRRRELVWVAAPILSLALAGGMYALAQAVKGDKSAVEIRHLVLTSDASLPARVITAVRIQSAKQCLRNVSFKAKKPLLRQPNTYRDIDRTRLRVAISSDRIDIDSVSMEKWSTRDFYFDSVTAPVPIPRVTHYPDQVVIENPGREPIRGAYFLTNNRWYTLSGEILGGGKRTFPLTPAQEMPDYSQSSSMPSDAKAQLLYSLRLMLGVREGLIGECRPAGLPEVAIAKRPEITRTTARCIFVFRPAERTAALGASGAIGQEGNR